MIVVVVDDDDDDDADDDAESHANVMLQTKESFQPGVFQSLCPMLMLKVN